MKHAAKKAKKLLHHVKTTYNIIGEEFSDTRNYFGPEYESFLPYLMQAAEVLDLGCGNGRLAGYIQSKPELSCNYLGIDNSKKLITIAKKKHPHAAFLVGDMLNIPVENGTADLITCLRSFHHLPSKRYRLQALQEMQRALKTNGILIITVWNLWRRPYYKHILKAIIRCIITFGSYAYNDTFIPWGQKTTRYYHAFTQAELLSLLTKAQFRILHTATGPDHLIIAQNAR